MNKQQILEQIDELKQKIEELEKEVNSPEFEGIKKGVRQKPKDGEVYFFLDSYGNIIWTKWHNNVQDLFRFNTGNYFKTEEQAKDFKENILTKQALKDLALELNNGAEVDFIDDEQTKFVIDCKIDLSNYKEHIEQDCRYNYMDLGQVYCLNGNFSKIAKDRIGEEKLIKLIQSGV